MNGDLPNERLGLIRVVRRVGVVVAGYFAYAVMAAFLPVGTPELSPTESVGPMAGLGLVAWRSYGCQSCHSVYGLGGHTGPDLTNAVSRFGEGYVRFALREGVRAMPPLGLSDTEIEAIVAYLKEADRSGVYPPPNLLAPVFGAGR